MKTKFFSNVSIGTFVFLNGVIVGRVHMSRFDGTCSSVNINIFAPSLYIQENKRNLQI